jgi:endonuclease I
MQKITLILLISIILLSSLSSPPRNINFDQYDVAEDRHSKNIIPLSQRLNNVNNKFNLAKQRRLKYKKSLKALHGAVQFASKELPIYSELQINDSINCEHIVPKSFFHHSPCYDTKTMESDLHHLYPAYQSINLLRGNRGFTDIEIYQVCDQGNNAYKVSKLRISKNNKFEPNNDSKGKVARECTYFFTRYTCLIAKMSEVIDIITMVEWHEKYLPSETERKREAEIFKVQKNHNPYITQPVNYMREAWLG